MSNCQNLIIISKILNKVKEIIMAQVPADIGCENETCIAKDECNRQVIAKNKTAREIHEFGGSPAKKCGKFIQK